MFQATDFPNINLVSSRVVTKYICFTTKAQFWGISTSTWVFLYNSEANIPLHLFDIYSYYLLF